VTPGEPVVSAANRLEQALGYQFRDRELLRLALVHRSLAAEVRSEASYERLEFLGDAVLQLAVTGYLYAEFPDLAEGEMAKVRAGVVDAGTLAALARKFEVGPELLLGHGEEITGGRCKDSILADVVEAIVGAVYVDAGFDRACDIVVRHWSELIDRRAASPGRHDYKTRLQERLARDAMRPRYEITESGPEHDKHFEAEVWAEDRMLGTGSGTSKKRAEQDAAHAATRHLNDQGA
jgi:ribonuclease-3